MLTPSSSTGVSMRAVPKSISGLAGYTGCRAANANSTLPHTCTSVKSVDVIIASSNSLQRVMHYSNKALATLEPCASRNKKTRYDSAVHREVSLADHMPADLATAPPVMMAWLSAVAPFRPEQQTEQLSAEKLATWNFIQSMPQWHTFE